MPLDLYPSATISRPYFIFLFGSILPSKYCGVKLSSGIIVLYVKSTLKKSRFFLCYTSACKGVNFLGDPKKEQSIVTGYFDTVLGENPVGQCH